MFQSTCSAFLLQGLARYISILSNGSFNFAKAFHRAVLTVGNAPVGNVPFSPHGGGLPDEGQNIAMFASQFQNFWGHVKLLSPGQVGGAAVYYIPVAATQVYTLLSRKDFTKMCPLFRWLRS